MAKKLTQEEFILRANLVHSGRYSYTKTKYRNSSSILTITCPLHGDFEQIANNHLRGQRCSECWKDVKGEKKVSNSKASFIKRANKVHSSKYTYDMDSYIDSRVKMKIICPTHKTFLQTPSAHCVGYGCPKCGNANKNRNIAILASHKFISRALKVHGNKYSYHEVNYVNAKTKVKILCADHGIFCQSPDNHLGGKGCPLCAASGFQRSKPASIYVIDTDSNFIGFGISGNITARLRTHKRNLKISNIKILNTYIFSCSGENILAAEQYIKENFANISTSIAGFKTEACTTDKLPEVLDYLRTCFDKD